MPRKSQYLRRFLPYYRKYLGMFLLDTLCAALTTSGDLVLPMLVRFLTQTGMQDRSALTVQLVLRIGLLYIGLRLIDSLARYYMASVGHIMGASMERDMRSELFDHLETLSFNFFDNTKIGQIMARMTHDLFDVTEFAHHGPENVFIALFEFVVAFIVLSRIDLSLTIIIFALLPVMTAIVLVFNYRLRIMFRKQRVQTGEINAAVEDSLLGIRVVKSFANEELEKQKFEAGNKAYLDLQKQGYYLMGQYQALLKLLDGIMYIAIVVIGSLYMIHGRIHASDLVAYVLYLNTLLAAIHLLVQFTEQFLRGITGIERFFQIIDTPSDITDSPDAKELGADVTGDIRFSQVSFSYTDDGTKVLEGINLHIHPGENVALVGPSGGGKTTLCNLIPRFYDVTKGSIAIDGKYIKTLTQKSLREHIGFVQQDVYLFSGTVFENIAYGKKGATRQEVVLAAKEAGAHDFIMHLKDGYDTYVGERGIKLSGGQKQRISIARVFLKNPPILILDEATSALDNESEQLVQASLERLAKGRTTLTIAHRLTTIRNVDRILVLTDKGIEEEGTHQELVKKGGIYAHLYQTYSDFVGQ